MAKDVDIRVEGLNTVLRALRTFPKEANDELRDASQQIAANTMAPAYKSAASAVPHWGAILSAGIKTKRDRVPSVNIGYRTPKASGGADPIMLRYPTSSGKGRNSPAPFENTNWIQRAKGYKSKAMDEWGHALTRVVNEWNRGF